MKRSLNSFIITIFYTIIICSLSSCKEPVADFTWEPLSPKVGETVKFTNLSTDALSYSWNFGDMSIGSEENPTHVYETEGNFIVDLRAHRGFNRMKKL